MHQPLNILLWWWFMLKQSHFAIVRLRWQLTKRSRDKMSRHWHILMRFAHHCCSSKWRKACFHLNAPLYQIQHPCSTNFCESSLFFAQHFSANCNYQAWTRWKSVSSHIPPLKQNKSAEVVLVGQLWKPCRIALSVRPNKQSPFLLTEALWAPVLDDCNRKNR